MPLTAFALNCSLKASNDREKSSTDRLLADVLAALMQYEVKGEIVRALSHDIKPGVLSDMGEGDDWPKLSGRHFRTRAPDLAWPALECGQARPGADGCVSRGDR